MNGDPTLKEIQKEWHGSYRAYIIGFAASILLTAISFLSVIFKIFESKTLLIFITVLALLQATVQLKFFLHIGEEPKPRWESVAFWFMLTILIIIALGSLWIMFDLNERMMTPMMKEMQHD